MTLQNFQDPNYLSSTDRDRGILQYMDSIYADAATINQSFWTEADLDSRFRAGDQQIWNSVYGNMPSARQKNFNFNRIRRNCNMISGYQREHRKSTTVLPVEGSDQQTSDDFTDLFFHLNANANVLFNISEAFDQTLTTGLSFLCPWIDFRDDPISGDIKLDVAPYNEFLIDPYFRKKDMSDCNFFWRRKWMTKDMARSLYPDDKELIDSLYCGNSNDGKFQYMPESYQNGMKNLLYVDEFWYRSTRPKKVIVDLKNGESIEWVGEDQNFLEEFQSDFPETLVMDRECSTVKLCLSIQGKVIYNDLNPMGIDEYPFVPVWAYYEPHLSYYPWRIQGVCRGLRDAQYLYNRRKVIELDICEAQITSGYIYKENSLVNPDDVFLSGQGKGLALKAEADMNDIREIQPPNIPQSLFEMSSILGQELQEISGVNEELLGSAVDDKSGILSMLRQGAGLTTLKVLFDQLDESQKILGKLLLKIMQQNYSYGKVQRILGRPPSEQFRNKAFQKFDCVVAEGADTDTQKQLEFAQLLHLREAGLPITGEDLAAASTLHNKAEMAEKWKAREEKAQQMQQFSEESQIKMVQAQIKDLESRAEANRGLGIERVSRVQENEAFAIERMAEAKKDRTQGLLNVVKMIQEMQQIDLGQIQTMLSIAEQLEMKEDVKENKEVSDVANGQQQLQATLQSQQQPQQPQQTQAPQPGIGL
jgi:hypothetical protein